MKDPPLPDADGGGGGAGALIERVGNPPDPAEGAAGAKNYGVELHLTHIDKTKQAFLQTTKPKHR